MRQFTPKNTGPFAVNDVKHISIYIDCRPLDIYEFASNPENLPRWAAGLATSDVMWDGTTWIAEAPFGRVRLRFSPSNGLGVMDHDVELESGVVVHNPMRVVPNGDGGELIFTLIRQANMTDLEFQNDCVADCFLRV